MTKIVLSAFAFAFALAGAIATNVSVASESIAATVVGTLASCKPIGTCDMAPGIKCVTQGQTTLYTISSTCEIQASGTFTAAL